MSQPPTLDELIAMGERAGCNPMEHANPCIDELYLSAEQLGANFAFAHAACTYFVPLARAHQKLRKEFQALVAACKTSGKLCGYNSDVLDRAESALKDTIA